MLHNLGLALVMGCQKQAPNVGYSYSKMPYIHDCFVSCSTQQAMPQVEDMRHISITVILLLPKVLSMTASQYVPTQCNKVPQK